MTPARLRSIAANVVIAGSLLFAVVGNGVAHARSLGKLVPPERILVASGIVLFFVALLQYAWVRNLEKGYERRGRADEAQLHLEIVAAACLTYWVIAVASGGVTRIAWRALDLPMQFFVYFVLLNAITPFLASTVARRASRVRDGL